jgi:heat shock protein HtpX
MYKAIAANKRNTILVMVVFVIIISLIGWIVSYFYGDVDIAYYVIGGAIIYAIIQYFIATGSMLSMSGAQEIEKADNPRLYRIVENLAITVGIQTPKIYIIDDPAPNAFSTGRDPKHAVVAATTGLLAIMDDRELESVMAHEMGHVQNYDIRVGMIAFGLVSAIGFLTDIVIRMFIFGGDSY